MEYNKIVSNSDTPEFEKAIEAQDPKWENLLVIPDDYDEIDYEIENGGFNMNDDLKFSYSQSQKEFDPFEITLASDGWEHDLSEDVWVGTACDERKRYKVSGICKRLGLGKESDTDDVVELFASDDQLTFSDEIDEVDILDDVKHLGKSLKELYQSLIEKYDNLDKN